MRRKQTASKKPLTLNVAEDAQKRDTLRYTPGRHGGKLVAILATREGQFRRDSFLRRATYGALSCRVRHGEEWSLGGSGLPFNGPRRAVCTICFQPRPPRLRQQDGSARWSSEAYGNRLRAVARVPSRERDRPSIQEIRLICSVGWRVGPSLNCGRERSVSERVMPHFSGNSP